MFKSLLLLLAILCWMMLNLSCSADSVVKVYTTEEPPLNFSTSVSKESAINEDVSGFSADVVREILTLTNNTTATMVLLPWARAYQYALHGENVFIFSIARTQQRERLFHWVGPIAEKKAILYSIKKNQITISSLDEAKKVTSIATLIDDSKEQYLKKQGFTNLSSSPAWSQAVKKLFINRAVLLTQTDLDAPFIVREAGYSSDAIKPVFELNKIQLYIGVSIKTPLQQVNAWQQALHTIKENGQFKKLVEKWANYYQINNWRYQNGMLQVVNE